jgi:acyl-CoA synthetase (AMP-forming)/AMP-acid ligase II
MAALPELLQRQALAHPSRTALKGPDSDISYSQMMQAAEALADQLRRLGVERVGLCGDNSLAWILANLACLLAEVVCGRGGVCPRAGFFLEIPNIASDRTCQPRLSAVR